MATQDGPAPTFSNGLVFLCDPGNPETYNGLPTKVGVQYSDRLTGGPVTGSLGGDCFWDSNEKAWVNDGLSDYVEIQPFSCPGQALTVSVWAKNDFTDWKDYGFLVSKRNSFILHPYPSTTKVGFIVYTDAGSGNAHFTGATLNEWHQWVGTYDGASAKIYLNGELKSTVSLTGTVDADAAGVMYIGADDFSTGRSIDGKIGPVRIYDTALTADQILENYEAGRKRYPL